jgi:hypothetical protein
MTAISFDQNWQYPGGTQPGIENMSYPNTELSHLI